MQELAKIKGINVGMSDCRRPVIWFEVISLSGNSIQVIDDIAGFIDEAGCYKLSDLEGELCIIETTDWTQKFIKIFK